VDQTGGEVMTLAPIANAGDLQSDEAKKSHTHALLRNIFPVEMIS
jgi:hypothetical protein